MNIKNLIKKAHEDYRLENVYYNSLIAMNYLIAVAALIGGGALIYDPSGKLLGFDARLLSHTGFNDFFIPGMILFLWIGMVPLKVAYMLWKRQDFALFLSLISSSLLTGWILGETLLIRALFPYHIAALIVAVLMMGLTIQLGRKHSSNVSN